MSDSKSIVAVLDANVLYPAPLRDFLLRLAESGLYIPKWSDDIHEEWTRNLLINRGDLKRSQLERTRQFMDQAFDESNVKGYKSLIEGLHLPDKDDRHVLAVAIRSEADIIVTFNKKDFPGKALKSYGIDVQAPDEFVMNLLKINILRVLESLNRLVDALKNPPQTHEQVLKTLRNSGLVKSVAMLRRAL